jgi:hypothetical protein
VTRPSHFVLGHLSLAGEAVRCRRVRAVGMAAAKSRQ